LKLIEGRTLTTDHQLLTVREVADTMRVSTMTVYRLIRDGEMPAIRVGKHFRLRTDDVAAYLESRTVNAGLNSGGSTWPVA
jgi:excisionase family DNA binding protein